MAKSKIKKTRSEIAKTYRLNLKSRAKSADPKIRRKAILQIKKNQELAKIRKKKFNTAATKSHPIGGTPSMDWITKIG